MLNFKIYFIFFTIFYDYLYGIYIKLKIET